MATDDSLKVYRPEEIVDNPFPGEEGATGADTLAGTGGQVVTAEKIKDNPFPQKRVAVELLSVSLNTKTKRILAEYKFTQTGAIQIGELVQGISGDIRISPDGITARDASGNTTFTIDGTDGSAVFKGEIRAGSLVSGKVIVGNNSVIVDGENKRIIVNDGTNDRVLIGYQENGF